MLHKPNTLYVEQRAGSFRYQDHSTTSLLEAAANSCNNMRLDANSCNNYAVNAKQARCSLKLGQGFQLLALHCFKG